MHPQLATSHKLCSNGSTASGFGIEKSIPARKIDPFTWCRWTQVEKKRSVETQKLAPVASNGVRTKSETGHIPR